MINKATSVALKFFALYMIFSVLVAIPSVLSIAWTTFPMDSEAISPLLIPGLLLAATIVLAAIGIGLLWKTANSLLPGEASASSGESAVDLDKLFRLAIAVMGLYFAFSALIALPYQWHTFQLARQHDLPSQAVPNLVSIAMRLVLGGWLIAKPKQWVRWLKNMGGQ